MGSTNRWLVTVLMFTLCGVDVRPVFAQTFAEWFAQKKTQLKYLSEQIAALQQYRAGVMQGYRIVSGGWDGIGNWLEGETGLHRGYYASLRTVNPLIRASPQATRIVQLAQQIPAQFDQLTGLALPAAYRTYGVSVRRTVLTEVDRELAALEKVLSGELTMSDGERLKWLDLLLERVQDQLDFSRSFCSRVRELMIQQRQESTDLQTLKNYYENYR